MNLNELTKVLARISVHTGQKPDRLTLAAWAAELDPNITFEQAIDAVTAHYREKTWQILPADINKHVRALRRRRLENAELTISDPPADVVNYLKWQKVRCEALAQGASRGDAEKTAWEAIGKTCPSPARVGPPPRQVRESIKLLADKKRLHPRETHETGPRIA